MNKLILKIGILTSLGLFMTYTGYGQEKKEQMMSNAQQGDEFDYSKKEIDAMHQGLLRDLKSAMGTEIKSYGLTRNKLVVNGKQQTPKLQKQMADKYLKKIIDMSYHYDINTGRVFE